MTNRDQSRANKAHNARKRPDRLPLQTGASLHVPATLKEAGYQYYWALDKDGGVERMEEAWYEKVKNERGEDIVRPAGGGFKHYLMRIEQKYYDEDMANQQKLNTDATNNQAQKLDEGEYVPVGRQQVVERDLI